MDSGGGWGAGDGAGGVCAVSGLPVPSARAASSALQASAAKRKTPREHTRERRAGRRPTSASTGGISRILSCQTKRCTRWSAICTRRRVRHLRVIARSGTIRGRPRRVARRLRRMRMVTRWRWLLPPLLLALLPAPARGAEGRVESVSAEEIASTGLMPALQAEGTRALRADGTVAAEIWIAKDLAKLEDGVFLGVVRLTEPGARCAREEHSSGHLHAALLVPARGRPARRLRAQSGFRRPHSSLRRRRLGAEAGVRRDDDALWADPGAAPSGGLAGRPRAGERERCRRFTKSRTGQRGSSFLSPSAARERRCRSTFAARSSR